MTINDLKQIRGVVKEELSSVEERLEQKIEEVNERLTSVGQGFNKRFTSVEERLEQKIEESGKNIMHDIAQFMDEQIAPMIEEKADKTDIERVERKLDLSLSRDLEQSNRLNKIESLPFIAHELKIKKH